MLGPARRAIETLIRDAAVTSWPMRWSNKRWADGVLTDDNDNPRNDAGQIIPFIEAEIIGGSNEIIGFASEGHRLWQHPGLLRLYLAVPTGAGTEEADLVSDAFSALMERKKIVISTSQSVWFGEFDSVDDVAEHVTGNYYVLMCSQHFVFRYEA